MERCATSFPTTSRSFIPILGSGRGATKAPWLKARPISLSFIRAMDFWFLRSKAVAASDHDGHEWFRDSARGPRKFRDPFDQARNNMHALTEIVEERSGGLLSKQDFVHGYAVVFPHVDYEGKPPPSADHAIIISRRHLASMDREILIAFKAWGRRPRELRAEQYQTLLNDCLMPKFRIIRRIGPDIEKASEKLLELTQQQAQVFEGLYAQDRVLVKGVAGSGKTFLALQRALTFARAGKRTLFVCYNSRACGLASSPSQ